MSSYYPANYSIDTLNLPADTQIIETERRLALRRYSGYLVEFPMVRERVASVILHDEQNNPLPLTSEVSRQGKPTAIVGYDGIAWLENLDEVSVLNVRLPDDTRCTANLTLNANQSISWKRTARLCVRGATDASYPVNAVITVGNERTGLAACTASLSNNSPSFGTSVTSFTLNSAEQPVSTNIYLDCDSALSLLDK